MAPVDDRPVAFLAPMRSEFRPLVRALSLRREDAGDLEVWRGIAGGIPVVATLTSMGTAAAARATERLLGHFPSARHVVVVGIAGGADPGVKVGDLIIPEVVIDGATGSEHRPVPLGTGSATPAARGKLHTSDDFIIDPARLADLIGRGVVALDMETSAVGAVCEREGRPWSVFRVISDMANDHSDSSVLALAHPDGTPNLPAAARHLLTHPRSIPRLLRLGQDATRACRAAAAAAARALATVGSAEGS
jgi:adenosylhomocysteine nucleosidase